MRQYDLTNYDNWLTEPYDRYYETLDEELEEHLEAMREMDDEEDQWNYCDEHNLKYRDIKAYL